MEYRFEDDEGELLKTGTAPILVEPVDVRIALKGDKPVRVEVLDHDGLRTGREVPVSNNEFRLEGARTRAFWYLLEW
jgi:hypothetical protein